MYRRGNACGTVLSLGHHVYKDGKWIQDEHVEPLDPSQWAGPSRVEVRGHQAKKNVNNDDNEMITHWKEMCKTHNFLRAITRYPNELNVHGDDNKLFFFKRNT